MRAPHSHAGCIFRTALARLRNRTAQRPLVAACAPTPAACATRLHCRDRCSNSLRACSCCSMCSYIRLGTRSNEFDESEDEHLAVLVEVVGDRLLRGRSDGVVRVQTARQHVLHLHQLLAVHGGARRRGRVEEGRTRGSVCGGAERRLRRGLRGWRLSQSAVALLFSARANGACACGVMCLIEWNGVRSSGRVSHCGSTAAAMKEKKSRGRRAPVLPQSD